MATELLPFVKMQAVGNDFVVIEAEQWPVGTDWGKQSLRLCDRKFGIGGDGLLVIDASETADVRMRMFNPDGSEDMCGNGLRCVALLAQTRGLFPSGDGRGTFETFAGIRTVSVNALVHPAVVIAEMGVPRFAPQELPAKAPANLEAVLDHPLIVEGCGELKISTVNTGSTHTVLWVDALPDDDTFFALSPLIETHPFFPERTSVLWAKIQNDGKDEGDPTLQIRIWERGVGETLGCGTGACAVAVLALTQKKVAGNLVHIRSQGGILQIQSEGPLSPLRMTGPAEIVYTGTITEQ